MNNYLFSDDLDEFPDLKAKRIKVNRLRYQQVKDALRLNRKYNIRSDSQIAEDFDLSPNTLKRIKHSRGYNKYLKRRQNGKIHRRNAEE